VKDTDSRERPMWRTRWTVPTGRYGDAPHPPVLLVFIRIGERNPNRTVPRLQELTHYLWQGERQRGGHHLYDGRIPIVARSGCAISARAVRPDVPPLRSRPPGAAPGGGRQPAREAADAREEEEAKVRRAGYQEQVRRAAQEYDAKKTAEREARAPSALTAGEFTDERWAAAQTTGWDGPKVSWQGHAYSILHACAHEPLSRCP
jgi:hypothetical protein